MKTKNAATGMMWMLAILALIVIFTLIYTGALGGLYRKVFSSADERIASLGDCDKDKTADFEDKCPCVLGEIDNSGCPSGYKIANSATGNEDRSCLKNCQSR